MIFGKTDLISHVETETTLSKEKSQKVIESILSGIMKALGEGKEARFLGFGSFSVLQAAARNGRNPRTGDVIQIAASKRPTFRGGKELKEAVNG